MPKEEHAREQKAAAQIREAAQQRRAVEGKMLSQGGVPVHHTDPPKAVKLELPKPLPPVAAPLAPAAAPLPVQKPPPLPVQKQPPPPPVLPKHEERPIPKFEPPRPSALPKAHEKPPADQKPPPKKG